MRKMWKMSASFEIRCRHHGKPAASIRSQR